MEVLVDNNDKKILTGPTEKIEEEISSSEKAFINEYLAITKDGLLIKKDSITVRMFTDSRGDFVMAYTFSELADSFVVGFPATIAQSDSSNVTAKILHPIPMARMYKNNIRFSSMPPPKFLLCYLMATQQLADSLPGFFDAARQSQIGTLISVLQKSLNLTDMKAGKPSVVMENVRTEHTRSEIKPPDTNFELPDFDNEPLTKRKPRYKH